jgi:hypothetical protein
MRPERRLKRRNGAVLAAPKKQPFESRRDVLAKVDSGFTTIYVTLLNEGTDCWRPVKAERVSEDLFQITGSRPEDEQWEFQPGQTVRCCERAFQNGKGLVAVELVQKMNGS